MVVVEEERKGSLKARYRMENAQPDDRGTIQNCHNSRAVTIHILLIHNHNPLRREQAAKIVTACVCVALLLKSQAHTHSKATTLQDTQASLASFFLMC